jgi:plastocyanin
VFTFSGSLGTFTLQDPSSPAQTFAVGGQVVTVTEAALPSGWQRGGIYCTAQSYVIQGATVRVNLGVDETAVCTFYNFKLGRVVVDKVSDPAGDVTRFEFAASWGVNFWLADGDAPYDSGWLLPGSYAVGEVNLPAGWVLTSAVCSDGSQPAAISLAPGETVTCTFVNRLERGRIVVDKVSDPAGDATVFEFAPSWGAGFVLTDAGLPVDSGELLPGSYAVGEVNLPAGWVLTSAVCSDGSQPAAISLQAGETVTCTFVNTKLGRVVVDKVSDPAGDATRFEFAASWGANFWLSGGDAPYDSGWLLPGAYALGEVKLPAGWLL